MIHTQIKTILDGCKNITQAAIADNTEINRGQLNAWLKTGKNISEEKVALIIHVLLERASPDPKAADYQIELDQLRQYPAYQREHNNSFPDQPVVASHPAYVPRAVESKITQHLAFQPFDIAILGGLKMGKSSCLNWLAHSLAKSHHVLRLDCHTNPEPLTAITEAAKQPSDTPTRHARLTRWDSFPDWARRHLITGKKPTTLIFDHLDALPMTTLQDLQDGLHHFINQRRHEPVLDQINLVLAYDESSPSMRHTRDHASGLIRDLSPHALTAFTEDEVAQLLQATLGLSEGLALEQTLEFAWTHFAGHPFLTHYWSHIVSEQTGFMDFDHALDTMRDQVQQELFQPFQHHLDDRITTALQAALLLQPSTDPLIQFTASDLSRQHLLWLIDSGLFVAGDGPPNAIVRCASSWVQAQFLETTPEKQDHA